jgi:hypothetical protein
MTFVTVKVTHIVVVLRLSRFGRGGPPGRLRRRPRPHRFGRRRRRRADGAALSGRNVRPNGAVDGRADDVAAVVVALVVARR